MFEGAVIGDHSVVNEGAIIQPGVKIWPNKEIETGAVVSTQHHLGIAGPPLDLWPLWRHRPGQRGHHARLRRAARRGLWRGPAQRLGRLRQPRRPQARHA